MESKYKFYIVIDGVIEPIQMIQDTANEVEAQEFLKTMRDIESLWIGLENGDMLAFNGLKYKSVYFKAMKV